MPAAGGGAARRWRRFGEMRWPRLGQGGSVGGGRHSWGINLGKGQAGSALGSRVTKGRGEGASELEGKDLGGFEERGR